MQSVVVPAPRSAPPVDEVPVELKPRLAACLTAAAAAWPGVKVDGDAFEHAMVERLASAASRDGLEAMHTEDLYLACGCAAGDPGALAAFETLCGPLIARSLASVGALDAELADLAQIIRLRLLVPPASGGVARIATYSARGPLKAWVRVVAVREAARMLPKARREIAVKDDVLFDAIGRDAGPEAGYMKRVYRAQFKDAFHAAVESLDDRARLLLRQHALDGLSIDELAAQYRVHRATAARWVEAARQAVLVATRRNMAESLGLSRSEIASVMRLIQSQLDVTLPEALRLAS